MRLEYEGTTLSIVRDGREVRVWTIAVGGTPCDRPVWCFDGTFDATAGTLKSGEWNDGLGERLPRSLARAVLGALMAPVRALEACQTTLPGTEPPRG